MNLKIGLLGMGLALAMSAQAGNQHGHEDAHAEGVHFGGYVHGAYAWKNNTDRAGDKGVGKFGVGEAAIHVGKKAGHAHGHIDLALTGNGSIDTNKTQLFVEMTNDTGFEWTLGRFDSKFNYEHKDVYMRTYNTASLLSATGSTVTTSQYALAYNAPIIHTGLGLNYAVSDMFHVHAVVSNASVGSTNVGDGLYDYGLRFMTALDTIDVAVGGLVTADEDDIGYVIDFVASSDFDMISAALYAVYSSAPGTSGNEELGLGLDLGYDVDDMMALGARVEWLQKGNDDTVIGVTVGPQMELAEDFTMRLDYTGYIYSADTGSDPDADHNVIAGVVYNF